MLINRKPAANVAGFLEMAIRVTVTNLNSVDRFYCPPLEATCKNTTSGDREGVGESGLQLSPSNIFIKKKSSLGNSFPGLRQF